MFVSEIFYSIQGEGPDLGMPAWFIRLAGCNFRCWFCDTKYALDLKQAKRITIESIVDSVSSNHCRNVVITGGEPFVQKDLLRLVTELTRKQFKASIETNGYFYSQSIVGMAKIIVSPKPQFLNTKYMSSLKKWSKNAVFKFVIDSKKDFNDALRICKLLDKYNDVYFMSQGIDNRKLKYKLQTLVKWVKEEAPFVKVTPRLQIYLYGNRRGL